MDRTDVRICALDRDNGISTSYNSRLVVNQVDTQIYDRRKLEITALTVQLLWKVYRRFKSIEIYTLRLFDGMKVDA